MKLWVMFLGKMATQIFYRMILRSIVDHKNFSLQSCGRNGGKDGVEALLYVMLDIVIYNDDGELHGDDGDCEVTEGLTLFGPTEDGADECDDKAVLGRLVK